MNKQNKLILRVFKAALKAAEAAEKVEDSKLENKYGTSRRPMGKHYDIFGNDPFPEPPTGKNPIVSCSRTCEKGCPPEYYAEYKSGEKEKISKEGYDELSAYFLKQQLENRLFRKGQENGVVHTVVFDGLLGQMRPERVLSRNERQLRAFAGEDIAHLEELLRKKLTPDGDLKEFHDRSKEFGSIFVHLKSPELGTETLVVLSPEGETLLKIVKDNSRKFEVK